MTIWWAKFELDMEYYEYLFPLIQNCKNGEFECRYISTLPTCPKKNVTNFLHYIRHFTFSHETVSLNYHHKYFGIYISWWNHQMRFKMVHSSPKNAKFRVRQFQVCYLHKTHLGPLQNVQQVPGELRQFEFTNQTWPYLFHLIIIILRTRVQIKRGKANLA